VNLEENKNIIKDNNNINIEKVIDNENLEVIENNNIIIKNNDIINIKKDTNENLEENKNIIEDNNNIIKDNNNKNLEINNNIEGDNNDENLESNEIVDNNINLEKQNNNDNLEERNIKDDNKMEQYINKENEESLNIEEDKNSNVKENSNLNIEKNKSFKLLGKEEENINLDNNNINIEGNKDINANIDLVNKEEGNYIIKDNNVNLEYNIQNDELEYKEKNLKDEKYKQELNIKLEYNQENNLENNLEQNAQQKKELDIIKEQKSEKKSKKNKNKQNSEQNYNKKILKNRINLMKEQKATSLYNKVKSNKILINDDRISKRLVKKNTPKRKYNSSFKTKYNENENNNNENSKIKIKIKSNESLDNSLKSKKLRKSKVNIFNNKKNNSLCSELLRSTMNNEKKLILIPYAKNKEKINKTFHTIGDAHGIPYPNLSVVNGILLGKQNYVNIIRDDDRKSLISRQSRKLENSTRKMSLSPNSNTGNNKELNVQEFNM
jgi:hypothetical protein